MICIEVIDTNLAIVVKECNATIFPAKIIQFSPHLFLARPKSAPEKLISTWAQSCSWRYTCPVKWKELGVSLSRPIPKRPKKESLVKSRTLDWLQTGPTTAVRTFCPSQAIQAPRTDKKTGNESFCTIVTTCLDMSLHRYEIITPRRLFVSRRKFHNELFDGTCSSTV